MPQLQIEANELTDTRVNFVSLVKRGANRIPFRITKKDEDEMIDLSKINRMFKAEPKAPAVVAAVVRKGADLDQAKDRLEKAGISIEKMEEQDTCYMFPQDGVTPHEDDALLKLDDDVALVVTGISKAFSNIDFESTTFGDVMATEGFFPSMCMATEMLRSTVGNIMQKADTAEEAADGIMKAVDEFKMFLGAMATVIPQHAFKADTIEGAVKPADETAADNTESETAEGTEAKKDDAADPETADATAEGAAEAAEDTAQAKKSEGEGGDAQDTTDDTASAGDQISDMATLMASVTKTLEGVQAAVTKQIQDLDTSVKGSVKEFGGRLDAIESRTQKTEEAVNGTVHNAAEDDATKGTRTRKSEKAPPLMDTAYMKADNDALAA